MGAYIDERIASLEAYVPGEQPRDREYIKLNANESPFPPSPGVLRAVSAAAGGLNMYPDAACRELKAAIAARYGVQSANVMVEDGSDNILNLCFMGFCAHGVAYPAVSYGFYSVFSALYGLDALEIPMGPGLTVEPERWLNLGRAVVIANPNAQTGIALPVPDIERIVAANPDRLVVVDEAYVDFGAESCVPMIYRYDNLLVTQTMSKSRSLAGGRVGYALGSPELIADLNRVKYSFHPYNVNRLSIAAGAAAVADEAYFAACTAAIRQTRAWTVGELENLGFTVLPSQANFVFAKHQQLPGETLYRKLKENGILVRWFDADRIRDYVRITIGSMEQMETLVEELTAILEEL